MIAGISSIDADPNGTALESSRNRDDWASKRAFVYFSSAACTPALFDCLCFVRDLMNVMCGVIDNNDAQKI